MIWIAIIILLVAADRCTKYLIVQNIDSGNSITVVDRFFYLTNHDNYGAAWGIFQKGRYFFIILTTIVSIFMIAFLMEYILGLLIVFLWKTIL
jgi:signal peptidase II